jgi:Zn finger protein HypA/HybF involved in hydrogenase expression
MLVKCVYCGYEYNKEEWGDTCPICCSPSQEIGIDYE